jgi:aminoglycoside 6'-N-acetyltransferase I
MNITTRRATKKDKAEWMEMRKGIWPEASDEYLGSDLDELLASDRDVAFLAFVEGQAVGMIEASLREYAEACESTPVGYIEGWFVYRGFRGMNVASLLVQAAEDWARENGCSEMASDTWLENESGIRAHIRLGYSEAERLVHFVKHL